MKYSEIVDSIDIDRFEEAIGFEPLGTTEMGEDHGHCPDFWGYHQHGDTTGKFSINRNKKVYNCFVCGGGSLLSLAMAYTGLDESDALDWLYQFTSDSRQTDDDFIEEIERLLTKHRDKESASLPWFNPNVLEQWQDPNQEVHDWLNFRGIGLEAAWNFRIGYNSETVRSNKNEKYTGPSIVFPHYWKGKLVGWQNRWLDDDRPKWIPKYTNTGDFPRKTTLYGWDVATESEVRGPIVVVESVPSVLFLHTLGIPAVATFGASVTPEQIKILRSCRNGVLLAQDNDTAGDLWAGTLKIGLENFIDVMDMPIEWEDDIGEPAMVSQPEVVKDCYLHPLYEF